MMKIESSLSVFQHPVTGKWNLRRSSGKSPFRFKKWFDTKEEAEAMLAELKENRIKAQKRQNTKVKTHDTIQYIPTGAKRRRAGGHGYTGGTGYTSLARNPVQ